MAKAKAKRPKTTEAGVARRQVLDQVSSGINANYSRPAVCRADELAGTYHIRRPFGIMPLDLHTGGGLPAGGACAISGEDQAGKTELLYYLMAMNQRIHGPNSKIALACTEGGLDLARCRAVGVQVELPPGWVQHENSIRAACDLPLLTDKEIGKTVGTLNVFDGDCGEDILEHALRFLRSNEYQLVLIDSLSTLLPQANLTKELTEDEKRAAWASMLTRFCNFVSHEFKSKPFADPNFSTLVGVQQMRANQDKANAPSHIQRYLPGSKPKEARSYQHLALVHLIISEGEKVYRTIKGVKTVIGKEMKWFVDKGKAGCHNHVRGDATFYFDGFGEAPGVNGYDSVITTGMQYGVLSEEADGMHLLWPKERARTVATGLHHLEELMREDVELEMELRYNILWRNHINVKFK